MIGWFPPLRVDHDKAHQGRRLAETQETGVPDLMVSFDFGMYRINSKDLQNSWANLADVLGHGPGVRGCSFLHHT
jgi:hypothetical protein